MKTSELVSQAILLSRADAIVAADRDGKIIFWNAGAERIFGYSAVSAEGASLDIIIPERLRQRHWEGYRRVVDGGQSRYGDGDLLAVPGLTSSGARISLEFTIARLTDETGQTIGLAAVMRDVTQRFEEIRTLRRKLADARPEADTGGAGC
jgi:PAS domain S-box-containing protein